jgi:uncharacterized caspase-like protein
VLRVNTIIWVLTGVLAVTPCGVAQEKPAPRRHHALVVGINSYTKLPKLRTAVNDARAVRGVLRDDYGYDVTLLEDATRAQVLARLASYRRTLERGDTLLIYYAGHGWLDPDSREGYWLPVDAAKDSPSNWISNADITNALKVIRANHVMVVADSCYSGALTRGLTVKVKKRDDKDLATLLKKRARVVLASGGLEPVEDADGGDHSVFAAQFVKALKENTGVLDGAGLFELVRRPVELNAHQTPTYGDVRFTGHDGGEFLFVRGGAKRLVQPPAPPPARPVRRPTPANPNADVAILKRAPGKLVVRAIGRSARGTPGSAQRMNWSKRKAVSLAREAALDALEEPPYSLTLAAAEAALKGARESFSIEEDGVVLKLTIRP